MNPPFPNEIVVSDLHSINRSSEVKIEGGLYITNYMIDYSPLFNENKNQNDKNIIECKIGDTKDDDLNPSRNTQIPYNSKCIYILHHKWSQLKFMGIQVWTAALLLCDYIIWKKDTFIDIIGIELGSGIGISSIILGHFASHIFTTDNCYKALVLCSRNIVINSHISKMNSISVKYLDWKESENLLRLEKAYHIPELRWTSKDIEKLTSLNYILCADVLFDDEITPSLVHTIFYLLNYNHKAKCIISIEKRYNFTLAEMSSVCQPLNYFLSLLPEYNLCVIDIINESSIPQVVEYKRNSDLDIYIIGIKK